MILRVLERFWAKVDRRGPNECWPWLGSRDERGYGQIAVGDSGAKCSVTHLALTAAGRLRPNKSSVAMHTCDNPPCVNPGHLAWATQQEIIDDMVAKGRQRAGVVPAEKIRRGEASSNAKLTAEIVRYIRSSPATTLVLAAELGVTNQCITRVRLRQTWAHVD